MYQCADCGMETYPVEPGIHETYFVRNRLWWRAVARDGAHYLCIGCLEERLGHLLVRSDFQDKTVQAFDEGGFPPGRRNGQVTERLATRLRKR